MLAYQGRAEDHCNRVSGRAPTTAPVEPGQRLRWKFPQQIGVVAQIVQYAEMPSRRGRSRRTAGAPGNRSPATAAKSNTGPRDAWADCRRTTAFCVRHRTAAAVAPRVTLACRITHGRTVRHEPSASALGCQLLAGSHRRWGFLHGCVRVCGYRPTP